jgi:hypothetical protein
VPLDLVGPCSCRVGPLDALDLIHPVRLDVGVALVAALVGPLDALDLVRFDVGEWLVGPICSICSICSICPICAICSLV